MKLEQCIGLNFTPDPVLNVAWQIFPQGWETPVGLQKQGGTSRPSCGASQSTGH